ncbi:hypothetical protein PIB30_052896 [Stylosanthes scabra]|uniref:Uncharacterized protein n=1 Tax=Stylosanthes scabra TaxID=79078 RepID=A0ABU6SI92_9FABA|nr:hypothetical protein [Stylosanthes scabra]
MKVSSTLVTSKFNKESGRGSLSRFKVRRKDISFAPSNIKRVLKLRKDPIPNAASYHERKANKDYRIDHVLEDLCIIGADWRAMLIHSIIIGENINVEEIIADQIYKFVYKTDVFSSLLFPSIIAALCADAKIPAIPDDILILQEPPIIGVAMTRTRETRARNPRPARQATPPQQQPPQEQPQPQFHHQQDFPSNFYTHFDASMSQIYRRLDQQQEENRKSFEAINTRMDRMDDQINFLCYSNKMANE